MLLITCKLQSGFLYWSSWRVKTSSMRATLSGRGCTYSGTWCLYIFQQSCCLFFCFTVQSNFSSISFLNNTVRLCLYRYIRYHKLIQNWSHGTAWYGIRLILAESIGFFPFYQVQTPKFLNVYTINIKMWQPANQKLPNVITPISVNLPHQLKTWLTRI